MSIISFKQVHFTYPGDELESLCGVDLEIEPGEFVAVLGHNGSGKSTLAKHMNAILVPDEGKVIVDGIDSSEEENVFEIMQIRELIGRVPLFGICLGHQLTALAMGGKTVKLKYGHRGANQPVLRLSDGRCFITSQNHGYAVVSESMEGLAKLSYRNANDMSCEGLDYPEQRCFTVQFHPEASAGPRDTEFLFDRFIALMEEEHHAQR